jgi:hypothetical protein
MARVPFKEYFTRRFIKSLLYGYLKRNAFRDIKVFCMFIGYQRSGHSFIGALLDAHPNAVMGMEVDALDLMQKGYSKNQIYYCLLRNAEIFTKKLGNIWTGYNYAIPGQYQGTYQRIDVIGDKKGGKSSLRLYEDHDLLKKLKNLTGIPLKILHVIRHPIDNITTMVVRNVPEGKIPDRNFIQERSDVYFMKASINEQLRQNKELDILDIYHEDFVKSPKEEMIRILRFLGLEPFPDYIEACVKKVYKEPHLSRHDLDWPEDLLLEFTEKSMKYSFLKKYFKND